MTVDGLLPRRKPPGGGAKSSTSPVAFQVIAPSCGSAATVVNRIGSLKRRTTWLIGSTPSAPLAGALEARVGATVLEAMVAVVNEKVCETELPVCVFPEIVAE